MAALNESSTVMEIGTGDPADLKDFHTDGYADDIHDGGIPPHLMEMDMIQIRLVDFRLRFTNDLIDSYRCILNRAGQRAFSDHGLDFPETPV